MNNTTGPRQRLVHKMDTPFPETLRATNLGDLQPGDPVNIEIDVVARYVARLLEVGDIRLP